MQLPVQKKTLIWVLISIFLALMIALGIYYLFFVEKKLQLTYPNGQEVFSANNTYQITWRARKIGRVGIMLIKEGEAGGKSSEWIAKDVPALDGKYDWKIFVWQEPRQDYRISIFEYPWQEGNKIDYSDSLFTIGGPEFASCDSLSVDKEWPFLPSNYPNLRLAFISKQNYNGNLEGLVGADKKCQTEAQNMAFQGTWKALLGDDETLAQDRLNLDGIFVNAISDATVTENVTCHQLWGKTFDDFFKKFSDTMTVNSEKFDSDFLVKDFANVWLGRINKNSPQQCVTAYTKFPAYDPNKIYSYTTTCQDWTIGQELVPGYMQGVSQTQNYPKCYNTQGVRVNAVSLSGLSAGILGSDNAQYFSPNTGKTCNNLQKLICVQQ